MEVIRLLNETPEVYSEKSRDFQLLCRLYDCVINGVKFDTDNIAKITDSHEIRTNLLPLLQTKLGFFTKIHMEDEALRRVLETFPLMVKNKGSLKAIGWAINVYLKTQGVRGSVLIVNTLENTTVYNTPLPDHTIIIGLNTIYQGSQTQLREVLKYILPAGFMYYLYFYTSMEELTSLIVSDATAVIYVSDDLNSMIRQKNLYPETTYEGDDAYEIKRRNLGAFALMEVIGNDLITSEIYTNGEIYAMKAKFDIPFGSRHRTIPLGATVINDYVQYHFYANSSWSAYTGPINLFLTQYEGKIYAAADHEVREFLSYPNDIDLTRGAYGWGTGNGVSSNMKFNLTATIPSDMYDLVEPNIPKSKCNPQGVDFSVHHLYRDISVYKKSQTLEEGKEGE